MKGKIIEKEELLAMLTDIYDQLEELENVLESNLTGLRQNWQAEQSVKVIACEEKLTALEKSMQPFDEMKVTDETRKENLKKKQGMQLELGF